MHFEIFLEKIQMRTKRGKQQLYKKRKQTLHINVINNTESKLALIMRVPSISKV